MENQKHDGSDLLKSQGGPYTEKGKALEDASSSAWVFTVMGIVGILALVLLWLGVIPLSMAFYMKCMLTVVMGALFLFFFFIGLKSIRQLKGLKAETSMEEKTTEEIIRWMVDTYSLKDLDLLAGIQDADETSDEQLYFIRIEKIASLINKRYGSLDEKYLDYLIEKIYETYSPGK